MFRGTQWRVRISSSRGVAEYEGVRSMLGLPCWVEEYKKREYPAAIKVKPAIGSSRGVAHEAKEIME